MPNTPSGELLTPAEEAGDDAPSDVWTSVGPPPVCHTWETISTRPSSPDWEISSVPW